MDKVAFPSLLKKLVDTGCFSRANAIRGFEGSGIFPLNKEKIVNKCDTSQFSCSENMNLHQDEIVTPNTSCANSDFSHNLRNKDRQTHQEESASITKFPISSKINLELVILASLEKN